MPRLTDFLDLGNLLPAVWASMTVWLAIRAARGRLSQREEGLWIGGAILACVLSICVGAFQKASVRREVETQRQEARREAETQRQQARREAHRARYETKRQLAPIRHRLLVPRPAFVASAATKPVLLPRAKRQPSVTSTTTPPTDIEEATGALGLEHRLRGVARDIEKFTADFLAAAPPTADQLWNTAPWASFEQRDQAQAKYLAHLASFEGAYSDHFAEAVSGLRRDLDRSGYFKEKEMDKLRRRPRNTREASAFARTLASFADALP